MKYVPTSLSSFTKKIIFRIFVLSYFCRPQISSQWRQRGRGIKGKFALTSLWRITSDYLSMYDFTQVETFIKGLAGSKMWTKQRFQFLFYSCHSLKFHQKIQNLLFLNLWPVHPKIYFVLDILDFVWADGWGIDFSNSCQCYLKSI